MTRLDVSVAKDLVESTAKLGLRERGVDYNSKRMAADAASKPFQPVLDGIIEQYEGQPVDEIKPVLAERWAAANEGSDITDPELTNVAESLSRGERVVLTDGS